MKKQLKRNLRLFLTGLNPLNKVIPKDKKRIVLYSNLGFRDNVKGIYDYILKSNLNDSYKIICACSDYKSYKYEKIHNIKFVGVFRGVLYFLTSKYFFYSFGKYPIQPSEEQVVINLWHGTPLKTIGALNKNEDFCRQDYFSYVLAAAPYFIPVMAQTFGVGEEKVLLCGHARNDKLFEDYTAVKKELLGKNSKLLMWLPTYRKTKGKEADSNQKNGETELPIFTSWELLKSLDEFLKKNNAMLLIKLHPLQEWKQDKVPCFENVVFYSHDRFMLEKLDLYELLSMTDGLITDYSSVYFDYLLLNRPIGFTIDDMESYSDTRGFVFDNPLDYMSGDKITDVETFQDFIENIVNGSDSYEEERKKVNDICNYYQDGNNSRRVLQKVGII